MRERVEGGEGGIRVGGEEGWLRVEEGGIQVGGQEEGRVGEVEGGMVEGGEGEIQVGYRKEGGQLFRGDRNQQGSTRQRWRVRHL